MPRGKIPRPLETPLPVGLSSLPTCAPLSTPARSRELRMIDQPSVPDQLQSATEAPHLHAQLCPAVLRAVSIRAPGEQQPLNWPGASQLVLPPDANTRSLVL